MTGPQIELLVATHLAVCVLAFATGALWTLQFHCPRVHTREADMADTGSTTERHPKRRAAGALVAVVALLAVGVSDAWFNAQHASDREAISAKADAKSVQMQLDHYRFCVNRYSQAMHTYQQTSRVATVRLQTAQEVRDNANSALWRLVTRSLATGTPVSKPTALNALGRYNAAAAAAKTAKRHLDAVRAAHPVPSPPAVACPRAKPATEDQP